MPVRCLDPTSQSIHSFDLSDEEWRALELKNQQTRHLRMPCCSAQVVLKRSSRDTRFFAHMALGGCKVAPAAAETEAHLQLKGMAVMAARVHGWTADAEVTGITPSGKPWKAEVLALRGNHKVAVEVQWSNETVAEILQRQERYAESGVRGLWLIRQPGFPIAHELPAVRIMGTLHGFQALIPSLAGLSARDRTNPKCWFHQTVSMGDFLNAAFSGRFQFGIPRKLDATVSVRCGLIQCEQASCRAQTRMLTGGEVLFGPNKCEFTPSEMERHPEPLRIVLNELSTEPYSNRDPVESYLRRECPNCGMAFGPTFQQEAYFRPARAHTFAIQLSDHWRDAIAHHNRYDEDKKREWCVY
jgi:hypothetical protein